MPTQIEPDRNQRVLITGATGFIGGRLVRAFAEKGWRVRALVRKVPMESEAANVEWVEADLIDPKTLEGIEDGVDVVVHSAALLGKWGTLPEAVRAVNVGATDHLLDRFSGTNLHRFIFLSAGGVTGPLPGRVVDETYACRPATVYERTKYEAEQHVLASVARGVPAFVVRPTFTYGPGDPHKVALFKAVQKGRYAYVNGGRSLNHPVYIDDLVRGVFRALEKGEVGEVYIVGGAKPVSKKDFAELIARTLDVPPPRISLPRWMAWMIGLGLEMLSKFTAGAPILTRQRVSIMADDFGYSIDKARRELGYEPEVDLETGLQRTVADFRERGLL